MVVVRATVTGVQGQRGRLSRRRRARQGAGRSEGLRAPPRLPPAKREPVARKTKTTTKAEAKGRVATTTTTPPR